MRLLSLVFATLVFSTIHRSVEADISITDFSLNSDSLSFQFSGTMPNTPPPHELFGIAFANRNIEASPGFALGRYEGAANATFSGSQLLRQSGRPVSTGDEFFGDYFYVAFNSDLAPGEVLEGEISAEWSDRVFDVSQIGTIDVYWGYDTGLVDSGTYLTSIFAVPEPSCFCISIFLGMALIFRRATPK